MAGGKVAIHSLGFLHRFRNIKWIVFRIFAMEWTKNHVLYLGSNKHTSNEHVNHFCLVLLCLFVNTCTLNVCYCSVIETPNPRSRTVAFVLEVEIVQWVSPHHYNHHGNSDVTLWLNSPEGIFATHYIHKHSFKNINLISS